MMMVIELLACTVSMKICTTSLWGMVVFKVPFFSLYWAVEVSFIFHRVWMYAYETVISAEWQQKTFLTFLYSCKILS